MTIVERLQQNGLAKDFHISGKARSVFTILHLAARSADLFEWESKEVLQDIMEDHKN